MSKNTGCTFCNEIFGLEVNNFFKLYLEDEFTKKGLTSRIVAESKNFLLMPMVGPLVPGYLLLVPKNHYLSFAHMSTKLLKEAEMIKQVMQQIFSDEYTIPVIFEHGPMSKERSGGCCSDHAHLHIVAVNVDVREKIENFGLKLRKLSFFPDVKEQVKRDVPYLYYENQKGEKYLIDAPVIHGQFIRKLIANEIGYTHLSSWRDNHQIPWMIDIVKRLRFIISKRDDDNLWLKNSLYI